MCFVGDQWLQFDVGPASLVTACNRQTDRQTDTGRPQEPVCFVGDQWLQFDVGPASLVTACDRQTDRQTPADS